MRRVAEHQEPPVFGDLDDAHSEHGLQSVCSRLRWSAVVCNFCSLCNRLQSSVLLAVPPAGQLAASAGGRCWRA
eukprot:2599119-Prymnesium_polylepis.1